MQLLQQQISASDQSIKAIGYPRIEEDVPMTLHVGLVGRDGIVLAGDKQIITTEMFASTSVSSKIKIDSAKRIAVAWARDEIADTIASEILNHGEVLEDESELRKLARETYSNSLNDWDKPNLRAELLVVSQRHLNKIFYLEVAESHCTMRRVEDKFFIGRSASPACYLTERYYEKTSVSQLTSLAAHTILAAGHLHPMGIKGLEIVKCTQDGVSRVPESAITLLEEEEEKNGAEFRRLLLAAV
jgi:20S proteasome alpha/beta subunit